MERREFEFQLYSGSSLLQEAFLSGGVCGLGEWERLRTRGMSTGPEGDVTRDDLRRRFLAQHSASVAMLEQCCNNSKQHRNNVATLCCAKNRR